MCALAALAIGAAPSPIRAANDPIVHVFVHIPMNVPAPLPGTHGPWYCAPHGGHVDRPISPALLYWYERYLRGHGMVRDHFGLGSWGASSSYVLDGHDVAFEADDHVEVLTHLSDARDFLPVILRVLRSDTQQSEALGEIIGVAAGAPRQRRVHVMVTLPERRLDVHALLTLHGIFADGVDGGASQYDDEGGVHVYSGVLPAHAARIEAQLRDAGFSPTVAPETFVTADAPPCPR